MNWLRALSAMAVLTLFGCVDTERVDIDATVEARLAFEREIDAQVEATVRAFNFDSEPFITAVPSQTSSSALTPLPRPTPSTVPTLTPTPSPLPVHTPVPKVLSVQEVVQGALPSIARLVTDSGGGTGFIYEVDDSVAYIVTNAHVIEGSDQVEIELGGVTYAGQILGRDTTMDIAVISICCGSFKALEFSSRVDLGQQIVAIGYAYGFAGEPTVTTGIVSATRGDASRGVDVIQTDAPINRGNSGGPMLAMDGSVVGMNTWKVTAFTSEGLGFAVVANAVRFRAPALVSNGSFEYEGLGFVRKGGPLSVSLSESNAVAISYIRARNFIAEVRVAATDQRVGFGSFDVQGERGQMVLVEPERCWTSTEFDQHTDRISTGLHKGSQVRLTVIDDRAVVKINSQPVCWLPWEFDDVGVILFGGDVGTQFTDVGVWVEGDRNDGKEEGRPAGEEGHRADP